jgi:hypothetical protein
MPTVRDGPVSPAAATMGAVSFPTDGLGDPEAECPRSAAYVAGGNVREGPVAHAVAKGATTPDCGESLIPG